MRNLSSLNSAKQVRQLADLADFPGGFVEALTQLVREAVRKEIRSALAEIAPVSAANADRLLDVAGAAGRLGLAPSTVYKMAQRLELPSVLLGRRRLFKPSDLDAFAQSRRSSPERVRELAAVVRGA